MMDWRQVTEGCSKQKSAEMGTMRYNISTLKQCITTTGNIRQVFESDIACFYIYVFSMKFRRFSQSVKRGKKLINRDFF